MSYFKKYGAVINFISICTLCFIAYILCQSQEFINRNKVTMARCFIIPTQGYTLDGHVRFFQESNDKLNFELEMFDHEVSEVSIYSRKNNLDNHCENLGEEIGKLNIKRVENLSTVINKKNNSLFSGNMNLRADGEVQGISLNDKGVYEYTCVAKLPRKKRDEVGEQEREYNSKIDNNYRIAGCGVIQSYELDSAYLFGLGSILLNTIFGSVYFYMYGI